MFLLDIEDMETEELGWNQSQQLSSWYTQSFWYSPGLLPACLALSIGNDFDWADDKIERIETAMDCAVIVGLQSFPNKLKQMSPLV